MVDGITPEQARAELVRRRVTMARSGEITPEQARAELARRAAERGDTDEGYERLSILPLRVHKETGEREFAMPQVLKSVVDAVKLPGEVARGETQVMGEDGRVTDEVIGKSLDLAGVISPGTIASRATPKAVATAKPLTDGQKAAVAGKNIGVDLPRAVVSDKTSVQQIGKTGAGVPFVGAPLRKSSNTAISQLDDAATRVQRQLGTGSRITAGGAVRNNVKDHATKVLPDRVKAAYDAVDELIDPNVRASLNNTRNMAAEIDALRRNAALRGSSKAVDEIRGALDRNEGLTYEGIKRLRTHIQSLLDAPDLTASGPAKAELKRIYTALTDDLRAAVFKAGGRKGFNAWAKANSLAAKTSREREELKKIFGKNLSDEGYISKVQSMASETSRANFSGLVRVQRAVSKETWDETASAVLASMGRGPDGNFSPDRFVTAWGKMSPTGKKMLFGRKKDLANSLDDIAAVSARFKQMNQFANPSGTSQANAATAAIATGSVGGVGYLTGLIEPVTVFTAAVGAGGARLVSQYLSNPIKTRKIAQWAKAAEGAAMRPSPLSRNILKERARALSITIAEDTEQDARQVMSDLMAAFE